MGAAVTTELQTIGHWIGGTGIRGDSGRNGPVYNPATGEQTGEVTFASTEEIDRAVAAAKDAFRQWRTWSLSKRADLFFRIHDLFVQHREDLARLLTAEHGKVLSDALGEVQRGLEVIEYVCGIPTLLKGSYSEQAATGIDVYSIRQPLGVTAGITPFNFPVMVPMWMWAPAIACGNTFVLKPSEKDPSASLLAAELLKEAGLPDGVFNVVQGDKVAVDGLLEHPDIASVSFVGSTPIARYVYETATKAGKRAQALGGAKNHMIVLPDGEGFFLGVSLLDDVTPEMDAYRDEIFGPVLSVVRVPTYDQALELVNENPYGNGVAIFTRGGGVARQFQFDVNVGMVGVNVPIPVPVAYYSFGGWKSSLFGDRHIYGPEGIDFYTRTKAVTARWPDPATSSVDLGFPQNR